MTGMYYDMTNDNIQDIAEKIAKKYDVIDDDDYFNDSLIDLINSTLSKCSSGGDNRLNALTNIIVQWCPGISHIETKMIVSFLLSNMPRESMQIILGKKVVITGRKVTPKDTKDIQNIIKMAKEEQGLV